MLNQKNTKKQGDVGLGVAIGWFAVHGHTVCIPISDSQEYDLIVDYFGTLSKVQVKTTRYQSPRGKYVVTLCTSGGNRSGIDKIKFFEPSKVDYVFVLTNCGTAYLIPSKKILGKRTLTINNLHDEFKVNMTGEQCIKK